MKVLFYSFLAGALNFLRKFLLERIIFKVGENKNVKV